MRSAPGCRCFAGGSGNGRRCSPTPRRSPPPAPGSFRDRLRRPPAHADPSSTPACLQRYPSSNQHTAVRLTHAVLRRSPFVDRSALVGGDTPGWDALQPVTVTDPGLFPLEDPADRLDPVAEHERQQAALAASSERERLGLLLAAESSGALVAAEMTHAGLPWRAAVHDRLLTELLGPRPSPGRRPGTLERLLGEIRGLRSP